MSRGGYDLLEEKIMNEKWKKATQDAEENPSIVIAPPSPPSRHEKWKKARQNKTGEYLSEDARLVVEKIVSNSINIVIIVCYLNYRSNLTLLFKCSRMLLKNNAPKGASPQLDGRTYYPQQ